MHYWSILFKEINKAWVTLLRKTQIVGQFLENFYWKIEFLFLYVYFLKFLTKNRAFGNNTIFSTTTFRFRGGGEFPAFPPPCLRPWSVVMLFYKTTKHKLIYNLTEGFLKEFVQNSCIDSNIDKLMEWKRLFMRIIQRMMSRGLNSLTFATEILILKQCPLLITICFGKRSKYYLQMQIFV